ncbi:plipastatin synthase subunit C [Ruminiclostridium hungatei]|uniref:Plipastatin synthase subunit C n=1 Tax=Ruminiclostridium hungatei TaxID=48256 RepID=A0A1V4SMU4_RUMHU|nr:condensation domain-containing protein [Ruminiclostridium hungatei]OPX45144.1 plipastatin synthase subunit C [Ruminiclostridium hungatei]
MCKPENKNVYSAGSGSNDNTSGMEFSDEFQAVLPLSPVQQGMLYHYMLRKDRAYLEQAVCLVEGELDLEILEYTVNRLIEENEILRTIYDYSQPDSPRQILLRKRLIKLEMIDLSGMEDQKNRINVFIENDADRNIDLTRETFRIAVMKLGESRYKMVCTYHHIIMDAWSIKQLEKLFFSTYYSRMKNLVHNNTNYQYSSYLEWIARQDYEKAREYWSLYLKEASAPIYQEQLSEKTEITSINIDISEYPDRIIRDIALCGKVTYNTVILAAWGIFVLKNYYKSDAVIGCVVSGRMIDVKNVEKICGLFVNTVPVLIPGNLSFIELLKKIQGDILKSSKFSYLSLGEIMSCANLKTNDNFMVINFNIDSEELIAPYEDFPFVIKDIYYRELANYELYLDVKKKQETCSININYNRHKFYFDAGDLRDEITGILEYMKNQLFSSVQDFISTGNNSDFIAADVEFNFE